MKHWQEAAVELGVEPGPLARWERGDGCGAKSAGRRRWECLDSFRVEELFAGRHLDAEWCCVFGDT